MLLNEGEFALERVDQSSWCLIHSLNERFNVPQLPSALLFPSNPRRFSLVTVAQAIHRILQSTIITNSNGTQQTSTNNRLALNGINTAPLGRRKRFIF